MNELFLDSMFFGVVISIIGYVIGLSLQKKVKALNPLLISIVFVILFLLIFKIEYQTYNESAKMLSYLLTPATVALAIPLYRQINVLKKHYKELFIGILSGVLSSAGSIFLMSKLFGFTNEQFVTLLPKSITTAIGMGMSEELGGTVNITVSVIVVTGVLGNILAEWILKLFKIRNPVAKGLAIGTSAHAIGTTKALEIGETEGAMSSLSIVVAGLMTVVSASFFAMWY